MVQAEAKLEAVNLASEVTVLRVATSTRDHTIAELHSQLGEARQAADRVTTSLESERMGLERTLAQRSDEVRELRAEARSRSNAYLRNRVIAVRQVLKHAELQVMRIKLSTWAAIVRREGGAGAHAQLMEDHAELTQQARSRPPPSKPCSARIHRILFVSQPLAFCCSP